MRDRRAVGAVRPLDRVQGHCRAMWRPQARSQHVGQPWLIHVVPDTRDACFEQRIVQIAPPRADIITTEIREGALAWPDDTREERLIWLADKVVPPYAISEGLVR